MCPKTTYDHSPFIWTSKEKVVLFVSKDNSRTRFRKIDKDKVVHICVPGHKPTTFGNSAKSCPICVPGHKPTTFGNSAKSCPICVPGHKPTTFGNSAKSCPICVPGQHWDTFYFLPRKSCLYLCPRTHSRPHLEIMRKVVLFVSQDTNRPHLEIMRKVVLFVSQDTLC